MEDHSESTAVAGSRAKRIWNALLSQKAGDNIPSVYYAVLVLVPLSRTAMTFLLPGQWQISGYYLDGAFYGLLFALGAMWLLSIIGLLATRQVRRGMGRLIASPVILFLGAIVTLIPRLFLPTTISGWPIDTVYSASRGKHFILAYEPMLTDTAYRVYSAGGSRLNPVWRVELAGTVLDYSEDGSLTENPHMILSKDEHLLVIGRGGHLTDAVLIDSRRPLTESVCVIAAEQEWRQRTETIERLLAEHNESSRPSNAQLSEADVRIQLGAWSLRIASVLEPAIPGEGWRVSCNIKKIGSSEGGRRSVQFVVSCQRNSDRYTFFREMALVEDLGRLMIVEQDSSLSWSSSEDKAICEHVRSALLKHAPSGTYLDCQD